MEWLKPFSRRKDAQAGETLFRQGDAATEILFVQSGRFRALEVDVVLEQGEVIGELGPDQPRSASEHRLSYASRPDRSSRSTTMRYGRCTSRIPDSASSSWNSWRSD